MTSAPGVAATRLPPPEVMQLLEAPPLPTLAESPTHRQGLLVHERELLPEKSLAEPMIWAAGLKINPRTYGRHAPLAYYGLTLLDFSTGEQRDLNLPADSVIGYPIWSPDGAHFAFTLTVDDGIELWIGQPGSSEVHKLVGPALNATLSTPCAWMPDGRRLLCRLVGDKHADLAGTLAAQRAAQLAEPTLLTAGWQEPLVDQWVVKQLLEAQLALIDVETGEATPLGTPAAFESVDPSPDGAYLLVSRISPPYPEMEGLSETHRSVELWDTAGHVLQVLESDKDDSPDRRAIQWDASSPATLAWVERDDGRDRVMMEPAPLSSVEPMQIFDTANRYAELDWLEGGQGALIGEYDPERRVKRFWHVVPGDPAEHPRLVAVTSVDSSVPTFGRPIYVRNPAGKQVVEVYNGGIYLRGETRSENSVESYLDYMKLDTLEVQRVWQADPTANESVLSVLARDGSRVLTRHETSREPPNYFVRGGRGEVFSQRLTDYSHPAPGLLEAHRIPLRFRRPDGYELSANLYVPADADPSVPLPAIMWAYPREYGADTQTLTLETGERFPDFERAFKLYFLLEGYAVLDDVSMPIVGSGGKANDTFIQQIVTNAKVTIDAAAATGYVDPNRIGVAGHSYGAFMVANLLVHSKLFSAGVALSGAYNRTLTPFGFQTERRTLWEATDTYLAMSPFLYSNSIHAPLLLVHGLQDQNAGTPALQSIQFYEAIRRTGGDADILLLPREGHSYRGRDAVLTTAATMLDFFNKHLKSKPAAAPTLPEQPSATGIRTAGNAPVETGKLP
ncbi:MAG TPA: prolyl oligopeptidase family serine peptidase [Gammaproteobacteria bacterium]|nr:prolyl oligopeptidase family serine peptidase [Gammaproteobacteria bacterium]